MRIGTIRDLVALARTQRIYAAIRQLGAKLTSNAEHDVSVRAPMIGAELYRVALIRRDRSARTRATCQGSLPDPTRS